MHHHKIWICTNFEIRKNDKGEIMIWMQHRFLVLANPFKVLRIDLGFPIKIAVFSFRTGSHLL